MNGVRRVAAISICALAATACTAILGLRDDYHEGDGAADGEASAPDGSGPDSPVSVDYFQSGASAVSNLTQTSVTLPSPMRVGDLVVVAVGWEDPNATPVVDDGNGPYFAVTNAVTIGNVHQQIFYHQVEMVNINQVSVTMSTTTGFLDVRVAEYGGPTTLALVAGDGGITQTPSATLSADPGELLVAAGMANRNFLDAASAPFKMRLLTPLANVLEDLVFVDASASYTATGTLTDAGNVVFQIVSFK